RVPSDPPELPAQMLVMKATPCPPGDPETPCPSCVAKAQLGWVFYTCMQCGLPTSLAAHPALPLGDAKEQKSTKPEESILRWRTERGETGMVTAIPRRVVNFSFALPKGVDPTKLKINVAGGGFVGNRDSCRDVQVTWMP